VVNGSLYLPSLGNYNNICEKLEMYEVPYTFNFDRLGFLSHSLDPDLIDQFDGCYLSVWSLGIVLTP
jgi:hypothetical protein